MFILNNQKLLNLIRYTPVLVVCLFIAVTHIILIQDNQEKANYHIKTLRESLLTQKREVIREQVYQISKQLRIARSGTDWELKETLKAEVNNIHRFIQSVYSQHANTTDIDLRKSILETLKPFLLFHSQEDIFILDQQGRQLITTPGLSDSPMIHQAYQQMNTNQQQTELFMQEKQIHQGQSGDVLFIKKFLPLQWFIGIKQSDKTAVHQMKERMLEWLSNYEYGEGGYFFVLDKKGTLLSHRYNDFFNLNLTPDNTVSQELLHKILTQTDQGGGYLNYQKPITVKEKVSLEQTIYVKEIKGWNWIIGTGFYSKHFENYLADKEAQLTHYNREGLMKLSFIAIFSTILLISVSLGVSHLIARRFNQFQQRILKHVNNLKQTKNQMEYMAHHDALTGLPNRVLMLKKINQNITLAQQNDTYIAVMFVDLDNFKNINDLHGHTFGDLLLTAIGHQFSKILNKKELVSRFGGDEFIFCFPGLNTPEEAYSKARLIHQALEKPLIIDDKSLSVGCSIGVTIYPTDSDNAEILISKADAVLYKSKSDNKGEALFYDQAISQQIQYDMAIENGLHQALKDFQIYILYQPQVNIISGKTIGVEALVRWEHETLGFIPPSKFIASAEKTGLIHKLGLFVFRQACEDIHQLSLDNELQRLSVNISPKQLLDPELPERFTKICLETGMPPQRITLEITENVLIDRLDEVMPILNQFRDKGFGLSLDDFGTGYSSLNYLHRLPLTEIKIDRSFTNQLPDSSQTEMLVKMIIRIGKFCNMTVVAEGVETKEQLTTLKAHHCDLIQGYYIDPPLPISQLEAQHQSKTIPGGNV